MLCLAHHYCVSGSGVHLIVILYTYNSYLALDQMFMVHKLDMYQGNQVTRIYERMNTFPTYFDSKILLSILENYFNEI